MSSISIPKRMIKGATKSININLKFRPSLFVLIVLIYQLTSNISNLLTKKA